MTPEAFIDKWSRSDRTERQAAQEHFIDLCRVLEEPTPNEAVDPDAYSFEKGVSKIDGRAGFADVWKRGCFGWEYKKDKANLDRAYQQLQLYSVALENPPLLVVSDTKRFRIYTNWTNTVQEKHDFALEDLAHTETRELVQNVFLHPERLEPKKTREHASIFARKRGLKSPRRPSPPSGPKSRCPAATSISNSTAPFIATFIRMSTTGQAKSALSVPQREEIRSATRRTLPLS